MNTQALAINDLIFDPKNARKHDDRNIGAIVDSLKRFGQQKPIVIDANNVVIAGNGTLAAAIKLGWTDVACVRSSLAGSERAAYAIADNRTAELAEWDDAALAEALVGLRDEDQELARVAGFDDDEIDNLVRETEPDQTVAEDEAPPAPDNPVTRLGDLWLLGEHRVLCGDSTKAEDVKRLLGDRKPFLMVTDPPYGVEYDPDWRNQVERADGTPYGAARLGVVENDGRADWTDAYRLFPGHVAYVWHAGRFAADLVVNLRGAEFDVRTQIIWRKPHLIIGRGHYHWQHEPCWYAVRKGGSAKWCGDRTQSTIWDIKLKDNTGDTNHSTQKPVECMARPIRNHGGGGDDVYDPFLGSGTTIIAADQLGRKCYGMEISPQYCDVIVRRWQNLAGKAARLDDDGRAFDEMASIRAA